MPNNPYKKQPVIDIHEVPDWDRRQDKWGELVKDVLSLTPGSSLPVLFETKKEAHHCRNAVRYRANIALGKPGVRTRLVEREDGKYELYLMRLNMSEE